MSEDRSWTGLIRRTLHRRGLASPYARPNNAEKKEEPGWSLSGLLNFMTGAAQQASSSGIVPEITANGVIEVDEGANDGVNRPSDVSSAQKPQTAQVTAIAEQQTTPQTPPRTSHVFEPATGQSPTSDSVFNSATPNNTPLEKIHSFLERKKQEGTPLNEIEYAGITAMLEKAREPTYEPEPFRFSSSPAKSVPPTPSRSPQPSFASPGPSETPTRKNIFSASTSLPTFTNNAASPSGTSPRKLVHNPNGEYRWMGAGSSRVSSSRRRRTPSRNAPQNDTAKRRRTGEDKEDSAAEPAFPSSKTAPAALGGSSAAGPSTPPRVQPLPRASIRLKTAPTVPSPLRNVVNGASPPGSPPSMGSGSPPMRTHAATVLTEIIEKVTPPPKPDIANPYETASPVKHAMPKMRKRMADHRAKEKEKQVELEKEKEKEKEKSEVMPSPKAIIEATVPKGVKRSRPPPNLGKSPSKIGVSESHLFGGIAESGYPGRFGANEYGPTIEEMDEDEPASLPKKKSRFVTIEEIEDEEMSNGTIYTKPSEVIEPSESALLKPSITVPSNAGPSTLNGTFTSPTSPTNLFGGSSKSSIFSSKSSLPKEPSKLRSSFIAEEEEDESNKSASSAPPPLASTGATLIATQQPEVPLDPKKVAMAIEESKLPVYVFKFTAPAVILDFPEARKIAASAPLSNIPNYDFWKPVPTASSSSSSSVPKANGGFAFPSSSSSVPKTFDWAAAGMKPSAPAAGGEWTCDTCMLKNSASATEKCAVCEAPRPDATPAKEEEVKSKPAPNPMPPPAPEVKAFDWAAAGLKPQPKPDGGSWTCSVCMLSNPASATDKCTVCESPRS